MVVPIHYRKTSENSIATYDFYDLATNTGFKTLFPIDSISGSTIVTSLVPEELNSYTKRVDNGVNTAVDSDFDIVFNKPAVVEGDAHIDLCLGAVRTTTASNTSFTISGALMHVNNAGTETMLGSEAAQTITFINLDSTEQWKMFSGVVSVPVTTLAEGDKLRLRVQVAAAGANNGIYIYHEPKGYYVGAVVLSTKSQVNVPFRIDL